MKWKLLFSLFAITALMSCEKKDVHSTSNLFSMPSDFEFAVNKAEAENSTELWVTRAPVFDKNCTSGTVNVVTAETELTEGVHFEIQNRTVSYNENSKPQFIVTLVVYPNKIEGEKKITLKLDYKTSMCPEEGRVRNKTVIIVKSK